MPKVTKSELAKYQIDLKAKTHEDMHLLIPKEVAATFRRVAKTAKMTTAELFEEMVEAHASGMSIKSKSR